MCVAVSFVPPTHYLFIYRTTSRSRPVVPRGGATLGRLLLGVRLEHGGDHLGVLARVRARLGTPILAGALAALEPLDRQLQLGDRLARLCARRVSWVIMVVCTTSRSTIIHEVHVM